MTETAAKTTGGPPETLVAALQRIVRPLVRFLIARSIPFPFISNVLRGVYVDVAVKEFPVRGKPLTIVDLSGVPTEIADVVVSLLCRLLFDFAVWSERDRMPPVLLVCEEAHRYVPEDARVGFAATARAITRLCRGHRPRSESCGLPALADDLILRIKSSSERAELRRGAIQKYRF